MYILKTSDGQHTQLGTSSGNKQVEPNDTYWITGWSAATRASVVVDGSYLVSNANGGDFHSVEVKEIGGGGMGGIRFETNP